MRDDSPWQEAYTANEAPEPLRHLLPLSLSCPLAARGCSRASLAYGEEMMDDQGKPSRETLQGDAPETMGPRPERNRIKDMYEENIYILIN